MTRFLLWVRLTPRPVGVPSSHWVLGKSTQLHVLVGVVGGGSTGSGSPGVSSGVSSGSAWQPAPSTATAASTAHSFLVLLTPRIVRPSRIGGGRTITPMGGTRALGRPPDRARDRAR